MAYAGQGDPGVACLCTQGPSGAAAYSCRLCLDNIIVPITEGLCQIFDDPYPGEGLRVREWAQSCYFGVPVTVQGKLCSKAGSCRFGDEMHLFRKSGLGFGHQCPSDGGWGSYSTCWSLLPFRDCCPHCPVSVPPPQLLSISEVLKTLRK